MHGTVRSGTKRYGTVQYAVELRGMHAMVLYGTVRTGKLPNILTLTPTLIVTLTIALDLTRTPITNHGH